MQRLPHPGSLPLIQTAVAGRARAEAELERQMAPRHPRVQHEQDPLQRLPIGESLATRIAKAPLPHGQKRLDELPQLVGNDPRRGSHRHPSQLDDECRRPSSSGSGSLHFDSTSKAIWSGCLDTLGWRRRSATCERWSISGFWTVSATCPGNAVRGQTSGGRIRTGVSEEGDEGSWPRTGRAPRSRLSCGADRATAGCSRECPESCGTSGTRRLLSRRPEAPPGGRGRTAALQRTEVVVASSADRGGECRSAPGASRRYVATTQLRGAVPSSSTALERQVLTVSARG